MPASHKDETRKGLTRRACTDHPLSFKPATLPGFGGRFIEERSDAYGYVYLMMLCHEATGNATFLEEALAVRSTPGALHRAEFDGAYDRAGFLEWGCPVSRHDIAAIWVAFFSRWQRYRC